MRPVGIDLIEAKPQDQVKTEEKKNRFVIIKGTDKNPFALEAGGAYIIVLEDKFKTGYECKTCDGDGYLKDTDCSLCKGTGHELDNSGKPTEAFCRECGRQRGTLGLIEAIGKATCKDCKGQGATIVIPQSAAQRPTTGTIMSIGHEVSQCTNCHGTGRVLIQGTVMAQKVLDTINPIPVFAPCLPCNQTGKVGLKLEVGDKVLYPVFAGTAIHFKQRGVCRIMMYTEIYGKVFGAGNMNDMVRVK